MSKGMKRIILSLLFSYPTWSKYTVSIFDDYSDLPLVRVGPPMRDLQRVNAWDFD